MYVSRLVIFSLHPVILYSIIQKPLLFRKGERMRNPVEWGKMSEFLYIKWKEKRMITIEWINPVKKTQTSLAGYAKK